MSEKLYFIGLPENSRPGDILGAIANEAGVDGGKVGDIDIKGSTAIVEVEAGASTPILEDLEEISGNQVNITKTSEDNYISHFFELARLVEIEREEEMERHEREIRNVSGREREEKGRAILHLKGRDEGKGFGGKILIKFLRQRKGETLPDTEISVGDLVMLSKNNPLREDNPTGTVSKKTKYSITVAFDSKPPGFLKDKGLRCDLYVNDITYQRQLEALKEIISQKEGRLRSLARKSLEEEDLEFESSDGDLEFFDENLNSSQKDAVKRALTAEDYFLIHGPPGTGKTITCVEVARQLVKDKGEDVLCTADSNTAVDNLVEWLAEAGEKVVRVGHPARVTPTLRSHTLDEIVQQNEKYERSQELRDKAESLMDKQDDLTHPSGRWRRGMSDEKIKSLAEEGRGSRGVPSSKIEEMASWLDIQERVDEIFSEIKKLEDEAVNEILDWADIVCATNSGCGSELLSGRDFDTVIIDEATQSTEPSCWVPITLAERVIMAGDHKQLPPTVLSEEAEGLNRTLFPSLIDRHGEEIRGILEVQYRMHGDIMSFSNHQFYDGVLKADESVVSHNLDDLIDGEIRGEKITERALDADKPIVFLDTSNVDAPERSRKGSTSKENPKEAEIVKSLALKLLDAGLKPENLAVITPYDDQAGLINGKLDYEDLEVDTVDGFQGREKEVILLSLVRSNEGGNIGFLDDVRRLNVSLTRAKRKIVIIGDSSTVSHHDTYSDLYDYISENGRVLKF